MSKIGKIKDVLVGFFEYNIMSRFVPLSPKKVTINLTYRCNSRCVMCNIWKRKKCAEMSNDSWSKILDDPIFKKISSITLSGGEALLTDDFLGKLNIFIEKMPKLKEIGLISNGLLTETIVEMVKKTAVVCKEHKIKLFVSVSLDGLGKIHDLSRGVKDAYKKVSKTILKLNKLKSKYDFGVGSGALIMKPTLDNYKDLEKWFVKNKIDFAFQIVGFHDTFVDNMDVKSEIDFTKDDSKKLFSFLKRQSKSKGLLDFRSYYWADILAMYRDGKNRTTPCPFLKDQFAIDAVGDVFYCLSEKSIGNCLKKKTVTSIYFDKENLKKREKMWKKTCRKCNSGCDVSEALAKDSLKYGWYLITGKIWNRK